MYMKTIYVVLLDADEATHLWGVYDDLAAAKSEVQDSSWSIYEYHKRDGSELELHCMYRLQLGIFVKKLARP
jgi:hypothetical protein